jgi:putative oxidoreductase
MLICNTKDIALFFVRVMLGVIFTAHGLQKTIGLFGGSGATGFAKWVATLGVPLLLGYIAAYTELIGGLMLLFGIAAELGALLEVAVMIGAIVLVHLKGGFFLPDGFEYALSLLVFSLAIVIGGPGCFALLRIFSR